jgi:hypothetical protein
MVDLAAEVQLIMVVAVVVAILVAVVESLIALHLVGR